MNIPFDENSHNFVPSAIRAVRASQDVMAQVGMTLQSQI